MADANEVLLALYDCIREATAAASAVGQPCDDLDTVFGLPVAEHVRCGSCGLVTHATRYTQYLYNTQVRYMWYLPGDPCAGVTAGLRVRESCKG